MRVNWYCFQATLRRRWKGYVAGALLVGLLGGVAMASLAGARRTDSAFHRFLHTGILSDMAIDAGPYDSGFVDQFARFPEVTRARTYVAFNLAPLRADGTPDFQYLQSEEFAGSLDGLYFDQDRIAITKGRAARADRVDEVVVSEYSTRTDRLRVGQRLDVGVFSRAQVQDPATYSGHVTPADRVALTVVGVGIFNDEVVQDDTDRGPRVLLTPAFTARELDLATYAWTGLKLRRGRADVAAVKARYLHVLPSGYPHFFHVTSVIEAQAQRALRPAAVALGVFGLIAAAGALLIAGQAIGRQVAIGRDDLDALRAVGAPPATTGSAGMIGAGVVIVGGTAVAVAVAVSLSPLAPVGAVRRVGAHPGVAADWTVLGTGAVVLVLVLGAMAVLAAVRQAPHLRTARGETGKSRPSGSARAMALAGAPASAVVGTRLALERGHGRTSVPVRSVMVGAVVAVVSLVTAVTFGSSLRSLIGHPALYGWNFGEALVSNGGYGTIDGAQARGLLDHDARVQAWSGWYFGSGELDGLNVPLLGGDLGAAVSPPMLSGHALAGRSDVVLGAGTLSQLHKRVGDTVRFTGSNGDEPLRIVGTATLPTIGILHGTHPSLGSGAIIVFDKVPGYDRNVETTHVVGPNAVFARFKPGVTGPAADRDLNRIADVLSQPPAQGVNVLPVQRPAEIVNDRAMGAAPAALAAGVAAAAVLSLTLTLAGSVRRRRRDLALLKVLGFTRRQLAATVAWQATVTTLVGVVVGLPLGIATGRWLWVLFARQLHVIARPAVPAVQLGLIVLGGFVVANLFAAGPGRIAGRTRAALALRRE